MKVDNESKKFIADALLTLLEQNAYHNITIGQIAESAHIGRRTFYRYFKTKDEVMEYISSELMDRFADTVLKNHADNLKTIAKSYFEFWENHIDTLLLLKKAHLLYFIEDNLPMLIQQVAFKTKHASKEALAALPAEQAELYLYMFHFRIAGFWRLTTLWCSETPRKTPEEMSVLMEKIVYSES